MARTLQTYVISREGEPNLRFKGVRLGSGSDEMTTISLYKTEGKNYVLAVDDKTTFQFMRSSESRAYKASSLKELLDIIRQRVSGGVYNEAAKKAFLEASDAEPDLRPYAVEDLS